MARKKHYPPSRLRYDQSHPTISVRVDRQMYDRLQTLKEQSGKSLGDVLREALGTQVPSAKNAHNRGYKKGLSEAEDRYRVRYRCSVCGGILTITSTEGKAAAARLMREAGWAHSRCIAEE